MYFAKETDYKEKTKSVRKFSRDRLIPRIRSSKSFKGKDFLTVDNGEEDLIKSITERDMDEIIKEYETNPYFRTKMNLILKELGMKKENQPVSSENKNKKKILSKDNLQSLKEKLKNWKNVQQAKLIEIEKEIKRVKEERKKKN